ncbi:unnamed protein product, partial [Schistosoma mattheei]
MAGTGDPDMYTPNGHTYSSLVDETNRFRSYPTYTQQLSHHLPHGTTVRQSVLAAASTTSNNSFFQQESSNSLLLNQTCSVPSNVTSNNTTTATITTTNNNNNNNGEESLTNGHFQSPMSHSNVSATNTFTTSLAPNSDKTPQLPSSSKSNTSIDECRRNSVTNTMLNTSSNRSEQVKATLQLPSIPRQCEWNIKVGSPTLAEVQKAVVNLKRGRAAGPDGLAPEVFKDGGPTLAISLISKIRASIIIGHLTKTRELQTRENQAGFRPGCHRIEHIFTILQVLEHRH